MNTYVSFELAKLLKEKGFDEPCVNLYYNPERCKKPTIAEAVMWLYEKHGVLVEVLETDLFNKFFYQMKRKDNTRLKNGDYNSPTEAYEAAIEYVLNNLINE